jgi:Ser/Thr protein kinase RdoA (MazF antagonist)
MSSIAAAAHALSADRRVDAHLGAALASAGDQAASRAEELAERSTPSPIHGDAAPDNIVRDGARLLLTDFEQGSIGPSPYDLAPMEMLVHRFGLDPERRAELLRGYGERAVVDHDNALTRLYEVAVIAGAIAPYAAHPIFADELRLRLASLEQPHSDVRWTPHRRLLAKLRST